jgi:chaperonin cofactor prefoldin
MVEKYNKAQKAKEKSIDELVEIKLKKEKKVLVEQLENHYESLYSDLLYKKQKEIENQKKEIEELNQKNQELQNTIKATEKEIEEKIAIGVRSRISFNNTKEQQTKKEIDELKSKNEKLQISISVMEKNIEDKNTEIETLKSDIKKLENTDTDKIIKDLKTKLGDANQKILGENILNDKIKELEKKIIDLTIDNREFSKNEDLIEELKSKNTSLNTNLNLTKIENIQNQELISSMVKGYIEGFQVIAHQERLEKINDNVQSTDNTTEQIKILIEENIKLYKDVEKEFDRLEEKIYRLENPNDNRNNNLHRQ